MLPSGGCNFALRVCNGSVPSQEQRRREDEEQRQAEEEKRRKAGEIEEAQREKEAKEALEALEAKLQVEFEEKKKQWETEVRDTCCSVMAFEVYILFSTMPVSVEPRCVGAYAYGPCADRNTKSTRAHRFLTQLFIELNLSCFTYVTQPTYPSSPLPLLYSCATCNSTLPARMRRRRS